MGAHHASVFLYKDYQDEIRILIEQVDKQNYASLRERTCQAIQRLQQEWPLSNLGWTKYENGIEQNVMTQEWPLLEHGDSSLATENEIRGRSVPTMRDLGYWFLIVLAEYLRPCPSPMGNWSIDDCDLLFIGQPTSKLLKPDANERSPWPLTDSSPYWLWLHPNAARSGWLPVEEVHRLYKQLHILENEVGAFDVRQIPNINVDNPIVIRDYLGYLRSGYKDTLAMLSTAAKLEQGLFMSIVSYA
jgi:hypothetical protein